MTLCQDDLSDRAAILLVSNLQTVYIAKNISG